MRLDDLKPLIKIARDAGYVIDKVDYDFGVAAAHPGRKIAILISEVFREERDGYVGYRVITENNLRNWIKENPIGDLSEGLSNGT